MCGRYTLSQTEHLAQMMREAGFLFEEFSEIRISPRFNVAPTQTVPVVFNDTPNRFSWAKWGLIPFWAKDEKIGAKMVNARAETVIEKPAFRTPFKKRRCLVPADGFYEWAKIGGKKVPHRFTLASGGPFAFAGLWEEWTPPTGGEPLRTCCVITTTPNELVASVHDRMPVILPSELRKRWMDPQTSVDDLCSLLIPYPAGGMRDTPVSTEVNRAISDHPGLINPLIGPPSDSQSFNLNSL